MDIISGLPEPILCHILSFLPIHFSVTTSVLARRWRFLWTSVRNLYFEGEYYGPDASNRMNFSDMVYRVLLLHNGPIDSFKIHAIHHNVTSLFQFDAWISTAIARNVQVLCLCSQSTVQLPQCCFKCKTLVQLTIEFYTISAKSGAVCLPRLKKLNLYSNSYEDDESLSNLVSGCSAIENLVIEMDKYECGLICCYVCSPTLKSLVVKFELACYEPHEHKLLLDVPAVQYLRVHDNVSLIIRAERLPSLVVAEIMFSDYFNYEHNISCWRDMFQFVEKLTTAKSLTFRSCVPMKVLNPTFSIATTTRFHNLTKLILEADWHILTELLESAYTLEVLDIQEVDDELKCWREPKHLPKCLLSSLKYVNIFGFAGGEHELNMIRYILRNAKFLKAMNIYSVSHGNGSSKRNMLRQILDKGCKCRLTFV